MVAQTILLQTREPGVSGLLVCNLRGSLLDWARYKCQDCLFNRMEHMRYLRRINIVNSNIYADWQDLRNNNGTYPRPYMAREHRNNTLIKRLITFH